MRNSGLLALAGYALGTAQVLLIDWFRGNAAHKRHLRALRSELRRLAGYSARWDLVSGVVPASDATPNVPRITGSYEKLLHDVDFLRTDEHVDDNTQQGLIDILDGAALLQRYDTSAREHLEKAVVTENREERARMYGRMVNYAQQYDAELDRWRTMVGSALIDVERRLRLSGHWQQVKRRLRPLRKGENPPPLPPVAGAS